MNTSRQQFQAVARGDVADASTLGRLISAIRSIAGRKVASPTTLVLRAAFRPTIPSTSRTRPSLGCPDRGGGGQQPGQARSQGITPDKLEQSQAQHAADLLTAGPRLPAAYSGAARWEPFPVRADVLSPGGPHSTIVRCRDPMSHSTRTWSRACARGRCSHQRQRGLCPAQAVWPSDQLSRRWLTSAA